MTPQIRSRYTLGFGYAAAITAVASGLLTIAKEKYDPLLAWMKSFAGHHWITHGIAVVLLFVIIGLVMSAREPKGDLEVEFRRLAILLIAATVIGGALVGLFYLFD